MNVNYEKSKKGNGKLEKDRIVDEKNHRQQIKNQNDKYPKQSSEEEPVDEDFYDETPCL